MITLLKYLLHDMLVQYRRTLLVLVTLTVSAASMLSSVALSGTMVELGTNQWRAENGYSDIIVVPSPASSSRYFSQFVSERFANDCEYRVFRASAPAAVMSADGPVDADAVGFNLDEYLKMMKLHFEAQGNLFPFEGNKAVISRKTADKLGIGLGDIITAEIGGNRHALEVCAITYAEGPFAFERDNPALLLPCAKLQACVGELGRVDAIFMKLKDPSAKGRVMRALSAAYQSCLVKESYSADQIRTQANRTAVPFVFMSVLLCFMAVYVLFTIFKGAVADRMKLMGLFRAVGATSRDTALVLAAESVLYGLMGGIMSWAAGTAMLWLVARMLSDAASYQYLSLRIGAPELLLALASAVATSLAGALACLVSERKSSICMQLRGEAGAVEKKRPAALAGAALALVALAVTLIWRSPSGMVVYIVCVVAMLAGMALAIPGICKPAARLIRAAARALPGIWRIAALNIGGRKDFAVSVTIVSIIVTTLVVTSTISVSDKASLEFFFGRLRYGIEFFMPGLDRQTLNRVRQMDGVEGVCGNCYSSTVEVAGQSIPIYRLQGVTREHADFVDYRFSSSRADPLAALEGGRNILLTETLKNLYGVEEGDSLTLKLYTNGGKYREAEYTVIGFFDNYYTKLGRFALISQQSFADDIGRGGYSSLFIRTEDARAVASRLEEAYYGKQTTMRIMQDERRDQTNENAKIIGAMLFISILAAATGVLGIINVTLLSFMRRKREMGLQYAIGMTAGDILRVTLAEQALSGLLGSAAGLAMGFVIAAAALPRLIYALQIAMRVFLDARAFLLGLAAGLSASLLSSVCCVLFLRRSNPMDGLKQEE